MKDAKENLHDEVEPSVRQGTIFLPMWVIGLLAILIFLGFSYVGLYGGDYNELVYEPFHSTNELGGFIPKDDFQLQMKIGAKAYELCVVCHQADGGGNPVQAPPLAGSEWVLAEGPNRIIRIPLVGLTGPIKAAGKEMNASMVAIAAGGALSDEQLAAVLTYIRNSWGNKASRVTVEDVQKVRADVKDRTDPYTAEELLKLPEAVP